ncbi:MAG TPA: hypothetical protein VJ810_08345 [Blastocatellia bacterium]|nr:hypothetical protein [Blastocatellia bacterium]
MLFYIVVWILIAIPCYLTGSVILSLIDSDIFDRPGDRFVIAIWLGILAFAIALQFISFFSPLSPAMGLAIFLSGSLAPLILSGVRAELFRVKSEISGKALMIGAALILGIAAYISQPPLNYDTGLYHLQSILWLAQHGAVPGVALIHGRLGFTSSWFALAAPFHHGELELRSFAILGGFVIAMQIIHLVITAYRVIAKEARLEDWFMTIATLLIAPAPFGLWWAFSPSPDLPALALTILVTWAMVAIAGKEAAAAAGSKSNARLVPLVMAAGAVTVKLNALPLLAISLLFFISGGGRLLKRVFIGVPASAALVAPQLISGVITSGCPLYPGPICFDLPWSVGIDGAKKAYADVLSFARWGDYLAGADAHGWLWNWLGNKHNHGVVLFLLCSLISAAVILYSRNKGKLYGDVWVISLAALGATWILYSAPNPRFLTGYSILIPAFIASGAPSIFSPAVFIAQLIPETDLKIRLARFLTLIASMISYAIILRFRHKAWALKASFAFLVFSALLPAKAVLFSLSDNLIIKRNYSSLLIPPTVPALAADDLIRQKVNDIDYLIPKTGRPIDRQCWAADLPCTPQLTNENIRLRDPALGLRGGFVRSN